MPDRARRRATKETAKRARVTDQGAEGPVRLLEPVPDMVGLYANFASVSHNVYEVTVDFGVVPTAADTEHIEQIVKSKGYIPAEQVARVRLPFGIMPRLLDALQTHLDQLVDEGLLDGQPSD